MCYSGHCPFESSMGECRRPYKLRHQPCPHEVDIEEEECGYCNGAGSIDEEPCEFCKGTGKVTP